MANAVTVLRVKVSSAQNLRNYGLTGKSNPFFLISFLNSLEKGTSPVLENTLEPKWDDDTFFEFDNIQNNDTLRIHFLHWDKDPAKEKSLGYIEIPLKDAAMDKIIKVGPKLGKDPIYGGKGLATGRAAIQYGFTTRPISEQRVVDTSYKALRVTCISGRNLAIKDTRGTSDPFCVLKFGGQTLKNKYIPRDLNPTWNTVHDFVDRRGYASNEAPLLIQVFDHDTFTDDDFMGEISVDVNLIPTGASLEKWFILKENNDKYAGEEVKGDIQVKIEKGKEFFI